MAFLTDDEKQALAKQISDVESRTHGEIVTVIAHSSDDYRYIPLLWAALLALCIPGIYYLLVQLGLNDWQPPEVHTDTLSWIYMAQVLVFLVATMFFQWAPVRIWLVPAYVKHQRASRHAREQFLTQHVHWTEHRAGILLFVSEAEHYVEIIVDHAIAEKVDDAIWGSVIDHFVSNVKEGRVALGFSTAIDDCRDVLWQHFPAEERQPASLPNHLIEV